MACAVRPAYFVPSGLKADVLFLQMQRSRNHFAVVLDEYGGTLGVVTINDLLEQLVGDLEDDADQVEPPSIEKLDSQTWLIRGEAALDEVSGALGVKLPEDEYDTFGGFVFGAYGSVPEDGSHFELETNGLQIKVTEIRDHRIVKSSVCCANSTDNA